METPTTAYTLGCIDHTGVSVYDFSCLFFLDPAMHENSKRALPTTDGGALLFVVQLCLTIPTLVGMEAMPPQPPQMDRMDQLRLLGVNPDIHFYALNLQHAYTMFMSSFDHTERRNLWRSIHLMAIDLTRITESPVPDIKADGAAILKQMEQG